MVAGVLLSAGCDTELTNDSGYGGWELAVSLHREEVLALRDSFRPSDPVSSARESELDPVSGVREAGTSRRSREGPREVSRKRSDEGARAGGAAQPGGSGSKSSKQVGFSLFFCDFQ